MHAYLACNWLEVLSVRGFTLHTPNIGLWMSTLHAVLYQSWYDPGKSVICVPCVYLKLCQVVKSALQWTQLSVSSKQLCFSIIGGSPVLL
jgi:hypothetical protein